MDDEEMLFGMSKLIDSENENENEYNRNPEIILIKAKRMEEDNEEKISPMMKLLYDDDSDCQSPNDESISEDEEEYLFKPSKLLYDDSYELVNKEEKNKTMKNKDIFFVDNNQFKNFKDIKEKGDITNDKFNNNESIKKKEKEILNNQNKESIINKELNKFKNNPYNNNNNLSKGINKEYLAKEKRIIVNKNTPKYKEDKNIIESKGNDYKIKILYNENNEKEEKVKEDDNKNNDNKNNEKEKEKENAIKVRYGRYKRHYYKMLNEKKKDIDSFDEKHDEEKIKEEKRVIKEKEEKKDNILGTEPNYQRKFVRKYRINLELKNENENKKENENMLTTIKPYYRRRFIRNKNINESTENEKSNKNEVKYERKFYINNQIEKDKSQKEKDKIQNGKENILNRNNNEGIIYRSKNYQINSKDKDKEKEREKEKDGREVGLIRPNKYYYEKERNIRIEETLVKETKTWKKSKLNRTVEEKEIEEEPNIFSKRRRYKNISDITEKSIKNETKEIPKANEIPIKKRIYQRKERKEEDEPNKFFQRTFYGRLNRRNDLSNEIKDEDHKIKEDKYTYYTKYNIRNNRDTLNILSSPYKYKSSYKRRNEIAGNSNNNNNGNNYKQNLELNQPIRNQNNKNEKKVKILNQNRTTKYLLNNNNYFRNKMNETKDNDKREVKTGNICDNNTISRLPNNFSFTRKTYFYSRNNK